MVQKYAISFGHRNNTRGGAAGEIDWTDDAGYALAAELRKRGAEVYIVQEHDGDGDPTFTYQGLGAIGGIVEAIDAKYGPLTGYLSIHYGGEPVDGFFTIAPDAGGLRSGATGAPVTTDGWDTNPLDVKAGTNIAKRIAATNTVPIRGGLKAYGVMSERQTGVGADGWRLAELQESVGIKEHGIRLILEWGNRLSARDNSFLKDMNWVRNVAAVAIADGLEDTFGPMGSGTTPKPVPAPTPTPGSNEVAPGMTEQMARLLFSDTGLPAFDKNGTISKLWLARGKETGLYPQLRRFLTGGAHDWYVFSDGWVVRVDAKTRVVVQK